MQSRSLKVSIVLLSSALCLVQQAAAWQATATTPAAKGKSETTVTIAPGGPPAVTGDTKDDKNAADAPIRVTVNEVIVPVTVTDDKGRFVADLDRKDFQIFEENKPQQIQFFTRERNQPVVVGFLLDMSTASRIHWKNFQNAT